MKTIKFFMGTLFTCALMLTSCQKDTLSVSETFVSLEVGEELQVTATLGDQDVTATAAWESSDPAVATVNAGLIKGVKIGTANVTVSYGGQSQIVEVTVSKVVEPIPVIKNPAADSVTVAVRVPKNTPFGLGIIGTINGWDNAAAVLPEWKFTRVDGTETWYQITLAYDAEANFKVLPICHEADGSEYTTWSIELTAIRTLTSNDMPEDEGWNKDNQKFSAPGAVDYYEVLAWSADPSVVFAAPGEYTFRFALAKSDSLPASGEVILTGNFASKSWGDSRRIMKLLNEDDNAKVYEYTDSVPAHFSFKVFVLDGDVQTWANGDNVPLSVELAKDGVVEYNDFVFPMPKPAAEE